MAKVHPPAIHRVLLLPLGRLPVPVHSQALALACNAVFRTQLACGDFDFLQNTSFALDVRDMRLGACIRLQGKRFKAASYSDASVTISGNLNEFLLLLTRREDPDTLFFNRRLYLQGDTELGLYIKNFLDAQEPPVALERVLAMLGDYLFGKRT